MLPEAVWNMPPLGTINLHASLLPKYRGAAPIQRAIMNGETETGVTTFFIQHEIDTGKIIFQEKIDIAENETGGELYNKLKDLGAKVLLKTVNAIAENNYPQIPQDHITDIPLAPKIFKQDCKIDWQKSAKAVYDQIRALHPYPGAYTLLDQKMFKIYKSTYHLSVNGPPGTLQTDNKTYLKIFCGLGCIQVLECQMEGKRKMSIDEFLRGNTMDTSVTLG
jgi:methionyl-tRNA formyltransferase (EC 2.1.2.9)